jgi:uncharacterized protein (DUF2252 family)
MAAARKKATLTRAQRASVGQALRDTVPRKSHGAWKLLLRPKRDPIEILAAMDSRRLPELVPIRYGRMLRSPFTFLRGAAAVMAHDLAHTPITGLRVQVCGDCHVLNFGLFATPERHLVFDLNDFDETNPGPWEWDVKRLVASLVIAGRDNKLSETQCEEAVLECVRAYREHMRECSCMTPMDVWYERRDMQFLIDTAPDAEAKKFREELAEEARGRVIEHLSPKVARVSGRRHRLVDHPPNLVHVHTADWRKLVRDSILAFRNSLSDERRVLLDRYQLADFALKVVGIGSVGTRCFVALFIADEDQSVMLQFKEAGRSVLEPYTGKSAYDNQGQRVVMGQRLMQSSSDIFLGWLRSRAGHDFYVRQLRDIKMSIPLEGFDIAQLKRYAEACGWTLSRAHAKSGDAASISGYLGKGDNFDRALAKFARAYADQTERDHAALVKAVKSGRVKARVEE